MAVRVTIRQLYKLVAIDKCLSRLGPNRGANLISKSDILVAGASRDERRTGAIEGVELIRYYAFKTISERLHTESGVNGSTDYE